MKDSLQPGLENELQFAISPGKTVPQLYPESEEFRAMPEVLATGYLVGLMEWACMELIRPHIDWPREQSVGTHFEFSHIAATPAGLTVTVKARTESVDGRKLAFSVWAHDGVDLISTGRFERFIVDEARFFERARYKRAKAA